MFHLHVRYVSKSAGTSAVRVFEYLSRTGKSAKKGDLVREVVCLNMPTWAAENGGYAYWRAAASTASRANARIGYLIEFAIPRDLSVADQRELVVAFALAVSRLDGGGRYQYSGNPLSLAIHEGYGANPHVHLFVSTSMDDGIRRSPNMWFMRHNPKRPENGGAKRSRAMAKTAWVLDVRELWAAMANQALETAGMPARLDHRSHTDRGILSEPSVHLGPSAAHLLRQQRPAPRVLKHNAVERRNREVLALAYDLELQQRKLALIELQANVQEHCARVWEALRNGNWRTTLDRHPLAGGAESIRLHATAYVLESHRANAMTLFQLAKDDGFRTMVRGAIGDDWDCQATKSGVWLLRPDSDQVVLIGPGYVATDVDDEVGIHAAITAANVMPYVAPVVASSGGAVGRFVESALQRLGLHWPSSIKRAKALKPMRRIAR